MIFGIGMDLCSVKRVDRIHKRFGRKLEWRILSQAEQTEGKITASRLARRIAAKEAVAKALGCGIGAKVSFQDIQILRASSGRPYVELSPHGQANFPDVTFHLSITEEEGVAGASVIATS